MNNSYRISYNALESREWTVEALLYSKKKNNKGVMLNSLVLFNQLKVNSFEINAEHQYPYLEVNHISAASGIIQEFKTLKGKDLPARARLIVKTNDVIISSVRPEKGLVAIIPPELNNCIVSNAFMVLTPTNISSKLLYFILRSNQVRQDLQSIATGTAVPAIKLKQLKEYQLPLYKLPSNKTEEAEYLYNEWKKRHDEKKSFSEIVDSIIEEYLYLQATSNTSKIPQSFVLKYNLLEERLDVGFYKAFQQLDKKINKEISVLKKTKNQVKLREVIKNFNVGATIKPNDFVANGIPFIRIQNLEIDGISIDNKNLTFIDLKLADRYQKSKVETGDILITKVGSVGKCAIVADNFSGAIVNQHLAVLSTNEQVIPKYLVYLFKTKWYQNLFNTYSGGSTQRFIQLNAIKEIVIPLPTIEIQKEIISKIEFELKMNQTDWLEAKLQKFTKSIFL